MVPQRSWKSASWRTANGQLEQHDVHSRAKEETKFAPALNNRIYVGNMPYTAQKADIEALLRDEGYKIANIDFSIDPFTRHNPSYCFVDMLTMEDSQRALGSLSGKPFLGRSLKIKPCVPKHNGRSPIHSHHLRDTRWGKTPGKISLKSPDRLSINLTSTATSNQRFENGRVYVGGLPKPTSNQVSDVDIRELFKDFEVQAVSKVKWPQDKQGIYSTYYAFVDLESAEEARRAVAKLDGIQRWGETINVKPTRRAGTIAQ